MRAKLDISGATRPGSVDNNDINYLNPKNRTRSVRPTFLKNTAKITNYTKQIILRAFRVLRGVYLNDRACYLKKRLNVKPHTPASNSSTHVAGSGLSLTAMLIHAPEVL
jgi:hypothetical protein